jgi:predicted peroxiredoxin
MTHDPACAAPTGAWTPHTVDGLAMLLWSLDPERPELLATPFFHAAAAAAMDVPVELYFAARAVHLLVPGVADGLCASAHAGKSIGQHLRDAHAHGARLFVCTEALQAQGLAGTPLIPQCEGHGGAVQFMARATDRRWQSLVF